jgi:nucleotide-binding universal stress UspA family protein
MTMFDRILVPIDFSDCSARAAEAAGRLANRFGSHVELMHAYDQPFYLRELAVADIEGLIRRSSNEALQSVIDDKLEGVEHVSAVAIAHRSAVRAICRHAVDSGATLIVMGTHGQTGVVRTVLGSVAERVVRMSGQDVLTLGPDASLETIPPSTILAATDLSEASNAALKSAGELANELGASLTIVYVGGDAPDATPTGETFATMDDVRAHWGRLLRRARVTQLSEVKEVETIVDFGARPADALCRIASERNVDLIVVGTHSRTGMSRMFLGSVAEKVVREAPCPVLIARTDPQ